MSPGDLGPLLLHARALWLALLLAQLLCDYALTGPWRDRRPRPGRAIGRALGHHALFALLAAGALLTFLPPRTALPAAAGAALAHLLAAAAGAGLARRRDRRFGVLAAEQALHLILLAAVAAAAAAASGAPRPVAPVLEKAAAIALAVAACWWFGAVAVRELLGALPAPPRDLPAGEKGPAGRPGAGRVIGILERLLVLSLVLAGAWGAAGLVVGAKSIARYKRIEREPAFAEAYLVGTLASVLLAVGAGLALRALL